MDRSIQRRGRDRTQPPSSGRQGTYRPVRTVTWQGQSMAFKIVERLKKGIMMRPPPSFITAAQFLNVGDNVGDSLPLDIIQDSIANCRQIKSELAIPCV